MEPTIVMCMLPVALAAFGIFVMSRRRRREKVIRATVYRPPFQQYPTDPRMASQQPAALAVHPFSGCKGSSMDLHNANIDRMAPNDERLAPVQIPIIDTHPPPHEPVIC
ncbi:unnamed protein product, partial [Mesorhabditis spiculigera]